MLRGGLHGCSSLVASLETLPQALKGVEAFKEQYLRIFEGNCDGSLC